MFPKIVGVIGAMNAVLLSIIFLFFNPYNSSLPTYSTIVIVALMLIAPALLALVGAIKSNKLWLYFSAIWALPYSVYMFLTPSLFKWLLLSIVLYMLAAILSKRTQPV